MKDKKHKHKKHKSNDQDKEKEYKTFDLPKIKEEPVSGDEISHRRDQESHSRSKRRHSSDDEHQSLSRNSRTHASSSRHEPYLPRRHDREPDSRNNRRNGHSFKNFDRRKVKEEPHTDYEWGRKDAKRDADKKGVNVNKAKPDFGLTGKLAEETNTFNGVVIKYSEPPEARKPKRRWRFYPFKGDEGLPTLYIHRQSAYLIGRDRKIADIPVDHPSCSKQHAVLQYRLVPFNRDDGSVGKRVRPYIIDLESANGSYVNNQKIEPKKYVELLEKDVIKFGFSSREYVLLHEHS